MEQIHPQENNKEQINPQENNWEQDVIMQIKAMEQEAMSGGAVDSEINQLEDIITGIMSKKLTPEEALTKANNIIAGRQDYH